MADAADLTTSLLARPPRAVLEAFDLHVIAGPDAGAHRRLGPGRVRVGTAPGCDVRLGDPTVSRLHCQLEIHGHGVHVTDLESTNGTFVDGVRVYSAELSAGGTVTLGATVLRLELAGEPVYVELSRADRFGRFLGASAEIRRIYAILERVAPTDATILIQGETGTGKEAPALAIHEASERADGPFVAVDCGAIAESLFESELFGHVRGAFSGAVIDRVGLFEQANGGTLFLDEIGELPLSLQPKLLRVLEMREIRRVGASTTKRVDVRVLAATNRLVARQVNDGTFREDLYYRLAVLEVLVPPLRARREDIPPLAAHFYRSFSGRADALPPEFLATLAARAWPGNVRELRNFIERSVSLGWVTQQGEKAPVIAASAPPGLEALLPVDLPLKEARIRTSPRRASASPAPVRSAARRRGKGGLASSFVAVTVTLADATSTLAGATSTLGAIPAAAPRRSMATTFAARSASASCARSSTHAATWAAVAGATHASSASARSRAVAKRRSGARWSPRSTTASSSGRIVGTTELGAGARSWRIRL